MTIKPNGDAGVRFCVSPCRSGSTMLLRAFSQHPDVACIYQSVKSTLRQPGRLKHGIVNGHSDVDSYLVNKETLGPHTIAEATYEVFRDDVDVRLTRPIFLFRDPVRTWNGWKKQGWNDFDVFELAYLSCYKWFIFARSSLSSTLCVTYEQLTSSPRLTTSRMLKYWGIPDRDLLQWGDNEDWRKKIIASDDFHASLKDGSFDHAIKSSTIELALDEHLLVDKDRIRAIRRGPTGAIYRTVKRIAVTQCEADQTPTPKFSKHKHRQSPKDA